MVQLFRRSLAAIVFAFATDAHAQSVTMPIGDIGQYFTPDNYPTAALRAGEQGRVVAKIDIDAAGVPTTCTVEVSSGSVSLDQHTCSIARTKLRFSPARDEGGHPIPAMYRLPVRWTLPPVVIEPGGVSLHANLVTEVTVDATGLVTSCRVVDRIGMPEGYDPCAGSQPGSFKAVLSRSGKPVGYKIVQTRESQTTLGD